MPVTFFYRSPARPGRRPGSRLRTERKPCLRSALCFFLHERRNPPSGEKGGFVRGQSEAPAERMTANRQMSTICAEPDEGANLPRPPIRNRGAGFWLKRVASAASAGMAACRSRQWSDPQALLGKCVFFGSGFFGDASQRKRTYFCFFCYARFDKRRYPLRGTEEGSEEACRILSPYTELERRQTTSGSATAGHEAMTSWPDARGSLSLRSNRSQVGQVPKSGAALKLPRPIGAVRRFLCLFLWLRGAKKEGVSGSSRRDRRA